MGHSRMVWWAAPPALRVMAIWNHATAMNTRANTAGARAGLRQRNGTSSSASRYASGAMLRCGFPDTAASRNEARSIATEGCRACSGSGGLTIQSNSMEPSKLA